MTDHVRRLFSLILLTFALTAVPIQLHAQSLDIGGIDVQLGQPLTTTVLKLRAAYDVNYDEGTKRWFISRKDGNPATYFGNLDVIADRVTRIQKAYNFDNDMYKLSDAYSMALRDSQRLGGTLSKTTLEQPDGQVRSVVTVYGRYVLEFTLPFTTKEGRIVGAGITVTLK